MSERNKRLVRQALEEVFAGGNLAALGDIFHRDFVNHEAGPRTPAGPEGLKMTAIADGSVHNGPAAEPLRQYAAMVDGGELSIA